MDPMTSTILSPINEEPIEDLLPAFPLANSLFPTPKEFPEIDDRRLDEILCLANASTSNASSSLFPTDPACAKEFSEIERRLSVLLLLPSSNELLLSPIASTSKASSSSSKASSFAPALFSGSFRKKPGAKGLEFAFVLKVLTGCCACCASDSAAELTDALTDANSANNLVVAEGCRKLPPPTRSVGTSSVHSSSLLDIELDTEMALSLAKISPSIPGDAAHEPPNETLSSACWAEKSESLSLNHSRSPCSSRDVDDDERCELKLICERNIFDDEPARAIRSSQLPLVGP
mmetsp:Transcript_17931/g.28616  ORF Transcript_17931/g.28616 Transcript_17931/m.28616 type:complete len:290 (+) Transcript_17931:554-1423(+)